MVNRKDSRHSSGAAQNSRFIKLGVIAAAHGIKGEVKVRTFTAVPEDITAYGPLSDSAGKTYLITITGSTKDALITRIKGVESRNDAEALRNTELFVPRDALPAPDENEYYYEDLAGLKLVTQDGAHWGTLVQMHNFGAGDLAEVRRESGEEEFLPFLRTVFTKMDFRTGTCVIHLPEIDAPETDAPKNDGDE